MASINVALAHRKLRARCFSSLKNSLACAATNKQSGGITGKIRSTLFEGMIDMNTSPPLLQQISQNAAGDISWKAARKLQRRARRSTIASPIMSALHGKNL